MSDQALRARERRPADPAAAAALLQARLRAGRLDPSRVRLAARLGHPAAAAATGEDPRQEPDLGDRLDEVLFQAEPEACVRAAAAAAAAADPGRGPRDPAAQALTAAEAWLACPCPEHAQAAATRAAALPPPPRLVMGAACWDEASPAEEADRAAFLAAAACTRLRAAPARADAVAAAGAAARAVGAEAVASAVEASLLGWALPST